MPVVLRSAFYGTALLALALLAACGGSSNSDNTPQPPPPPPQSPPRSVNLELLGRFSTGDFNVDASGPLVWYGESKVALVTNRHANRIDVLSLSNPASPQQIASLDASADAAQALGRSMGQVSSVAVHDESGSDTSKDRIAVTVLGAAVADPGAVAIYRALDRSLLTVLQTGVGPGSAAFSSDGRFVVTADEGEPSPDYSVDPEGSISVVDLTPDPVAPATSAPPAITVLGFADFNVSGVTPIPTGSRENEIFAGVRFPIKPAPLPVATRAQDLEPESVSIGINGRAYVSLQENNAFATVQLIPPRIESILPFGRKDYSIPGNALDTNDGDHTAVFNSRPVKAYYQPGTIMAFRNSSEILLLTANTGAPKVLPSFDERARASDLLLDPTAFPDAAGLQTPEQMGRLYVSANEGSDAATATVPADPDFENLFIFGTRSFSIFRVAGTIANDSLGDFERITAERMGGNFNSRADSNGSGDALSVESGPAPNALALGQIDGATFAFIGLTQPGGVMVYALEGDLLFLRFIDYRNERNFDVPVSFADADGDGSADSNPAAGDLGPRGLAFVPTSSSPTADSLLIVGNAVSGTTSVYAVKAVP
ncbi:MAG: choice-of-anchor I family protein [Lysobacterales bacterium]